MSAAPLETLFRRIRRRAKPVGLCDATPDHPLARLAPEGARAFVSDYAWMLVTPVGSADPDRIREAASGAQQCLDDAFSMRPDTPGTVTDGYIVIALSVKPGDDAAATVRTVELSTAVCRKHVVWWDERRWQRVDTVTLLALPKPPRTSGRAAFPSMTEAQRKLVEDVRADVKGAIEQTLKAGGIGDAA